MPSVVFFIGRSMQVALVPVGLPAKAVVVNHSVTLALLHRPEAPGVGLPLSLSVVATMPTVGPLDSAQPAEMFCPGALKNSKSGRLLEKSRTIIASEKVQEPSSSGQKPVTVGGPSGVGVGRIQACPASSIVFFTSMGVASSAPLRP